MKNILKNILKPKIDENSNANNMKNQIKNLIKLEIDKIEDEGIYALSLYVYDENDNPCKPTVVFGYNTERQVKLQLKKASSEIEAKWNYAFWIQNKLFVYGDDDTRNEIKKWLSINKLPFYDDDSPKWNSDCVYDKVEDITNKFIDTLVEIVKEIHQEGILEGKFGKEIPILIHELEYYDTIAQQNIRANGSKLVKEFVSFVEEE